MMQNNESNNKFMKFWKTKGYYMLLIFCLAAIGVSGYLLVDGAMKEQQALEESMSVPLREQTVQTESALQPETEKQVSADSSEASAETQLEQAVETDAALEQTVMPVSGTVVQDYAMECLTYNPTTQDWRVHNGVDLAAPLGQTVKAARNGTVTAVYEDDYLGHTVVVSHGDGYASHYCNLAPELSVSAGDTVTAGQALGVIGNSALIEVAEEPHLHFEVYHNGEPVNPAGFLY